MSNTKKQVNKKFDKRCKRCVISDKYPGVSLNNKGICNLCSLYKKEDVDVLGEAALNKVLHKYRNRGKYNCAVAFSGGKDSTYALYLLKKKYNLNVLAITGDDYLASEQAWKNRFNVVKKLSVDHIIVSYDWNLYKEVYRAAIVKSGMRPRAINLVHNLMHQKAIYEILQKYNIPLLIMGNSQDELNLFKEWERRLNFKSTGIYSYDYWKNWREAYIKVLNEILPNYLRTRIPDIIWSEPRKNDPVSEVKHLPLFRYESFDVEKNIEIIKRELGWKLPTDVGGTETDSAGLQFDVCIYRKLHSNEEYAAQISKLIRNRTITREIAWKALNYKDKSIVKRFFDDFRLSWKHLKPEKCSPFLNKWLDLFLPIR